MPVISRVWLNDTQARSWTVGGAVREGVRQYAKAEAIYMGAKPAEPVELRTGQKGDGLLLETLSV